MSSKGTQIKDIKDQKFLSKIVSVFYLQDAGSVRIPYQTTRNYRLILTLLLSALFQRYGIAFAVVLTLQIIIQLFFDIKNLIRKRASGSTERYNERSLILIELVCLFESVIFLLVGIMGFSDNREIGTWSNLLLVLLVIWMTLSICHSIFALCMKTSLEFYIPDV
jgi:hypothetical protein